MLGKSPNQSQKNLFQPLLNDFINLEHELVLLSKKIDWTVFEKEFSGLYSDTGTPAKPIRLMTGLLILKQVFDYGDETLMPAWVGNPYFQYFCGEAHFQWDFPCDPSDLVHFRKRIGADGIEKILSQSIKIHGKAAMSDEVIFDTTAQEKNITYPTDTKLKWKYEPRLDLFKRVLEQKKDDKNKIYSLHETDVACIAKGKVHKPYEFGSKVSLAITRNTNIIVGAVDFKGNPHDTQTIAPTLEQYERLIGNFKSWMNTLVQQLFLATINLWLIAFANYRSCLNFVYCAEARVVKD